MENFYRIQQQQPVITKSLKFQALNWELSHENDPQLSEELLQERTYCEGAPRALLKYCKINCFGVTEDGNSVLVSINGFEPYFYISPENDTEFSEELFRKLKMQIKTYLRYIPEDMLNDLTIDEQMVFYLIKIFLINFRENNPVKDENEIEEEMDIETYDELIQNCKQYLPKLNSYNLTKLEKQISDINTKSKLKLSNVISNIFSDLKSQLPKKPPVPKFYNLQEHFLFEKSEIQYLKNYYGFRNGEKNPVYKLVFNNYNVMKMIIRKLKYNSREQKYTEFQKKYTFYEDNVDPIIRFVHQLELQPCGWIHAKNLISYADREYYTQYGYETHMRFISPLNIDKISPLRQASFDIEVQSSLKDPANENVRRFPLPEVYGNYVAQIATAFKTFGDSQFLVKNILILGDCAPIEPSEDNVPIVVETFASEKELLLRFRDLIRNMDPDVIYTYNGDGFDWNYLYIRAIQNDIAADFFKIGKVNIMCPILAEKFESGAYGHRDYCRPYPYGRINFDVMIYIMREKKLESYKLDDVAEEFLGEKKHPVTAQQMFKIFESGNAEDMAVVARYCIQDTLLPQKLIDKLFIFTTQTEMANVTYAPMQSLLTRGQQTKVYSQIVKRTMKMDFVIPHYEVDEKQRQAEGKFKGATVLTATPGAYWNPISVLDFSSLYPSIIRAHNFCYCTFVQEIGGKYDNLPHIEYHTVEWEEAERDAKGKETGKTVKHKYKFAKWMLDESGKRIGRVESVLPGLLADLTVWRKNAKKLMEAETDPFKRNIYNGRQLALKVSSNSVYGFLAAYVIRCKPIAACVTTTGRNMISASKDYAETTFTDWANENIYKNLVLGEIPVLVKHKYTGRLKLITTDELYDEMRENQFEIITEDGWAEIQKISRVQIDKSYFSQQNSGVIFSKNDPLFNKYKTIDKKELTNLIYDSNISGKIYSSDEIENLVKKRKMPDEFLTQRIEKKRQYLEQWSKCYSKE